VNDTAHEYFSEMIKDSKNEIKGRANAEKRQTIKMDE